MTQQSEQLYESCKELREALRIALLMLVGNYLDESFYESCKVHGVEDGIGVRANQAIERYEKTRLGILSEVPA